MTYVYDKMSKARKLQSSNETIREIIECQREEPWKIPFASSHGENRSLVTDVELEKSRITVTALEIWRHL